MGEIKVSMTRLTLVIVISFSNVFFKETCHLGLFEDLHLILRWGLEIFYVFWVRKDLPRRFGDNNPEELDGVGKDDNDADGQKH